MSVRRLPFPPPPANLTPELRAYLNAVRDYIEVLTTGVAVPTRRAVTFEDLVDMGVINQAMANDQAAVK